MGLRNPSSTSEGSYSAFAISQSGLRATTRVKDEKHTITITTAKGVENRFESPTPVHSLTIAPNEKRLAILNPYKIVICNFEGEVLHEIKNERSDEIHFRLIEFISFFVIGGDFS